MSDATTLDAATPATPDPGRRRHVHLGQHRLVRLQTVNWGTFCGYKDVAVDERGVLFTGPSGSGKSSLMDAHSVALLPTGDHGLNASADLSARGSKQAARTVSDYVRGAWSETDDEHERSRVRYLRPGATWSAIAATYDDGIGTVTTGCTLKWFTGSGTDAASMRQVYAVFDGDLDLTDLNEWAARGFDTRWFKTGHPGAYFDTQGAYLEELGRRIGLGSSKAARALLGKAKAMKNVGDLNLFIRRHMLDRPATYDAATRMLAAYTPLEDAYVTAERAHAQRQVLREVPRAWETFTRAADRHGMAETLLAGPLDAWLAARRRASIEAELAEVDEQTSALDAEQGRLAEEADLLRESYDSLTEQIGGGDRALIELTRRRDTAAAQLGTCERQRDMWLRQVARVGVEAPEDAAGFERLRTRLPRLAADAEAELADLTPTLHETYARQSSSRTAHRGKLRELQALESAGSLIPTRTAERRRLIADNTGLPASDLPFVAELVDVAPGEERWRPAAEKVLRGFGLRMLVPLSHRLEVARFIDGHDMRGVVEYSVVGEAASASADTSAAEPGTLASKLVVDATHPAGAWLREELDRQFRHACVETSAEMDDHRLAVTVRGTVKSGANRYRKDDRAELMDPAAYILGGDIGVKRGALQEEVMRLAEAAAAADREARAAGERERLLRARIEGCAGAEEFRHWADLDASGVEALVADLDRRIVEMRAEDVDLRRLTARADEAKTDWEEAEKAALRIGTRIELLADRSTELVGLMERETGDIPDLDEEHRAWLDEVRAGIEASDALEDFPVLREAMRSRLRHQAEAATRERDLARATLRTAIDRFVENWPESAPDTIAEIERVGGDYVALYQRIVDRALPDALARLQQLIGGEMVSSVGLLAHAVDEAGAAIERGIREVNTGLRRVEFNRGEDGTGSFLQIVARPHPGGEVREFHALVGELFEHNASAGRDSGEALRQFKRVRALMSRFTADSGEDRRWRDAVLDVRGNFTFYGREVDAAGETVHTYRNTAGSSGGEQEKLVAFCLAAALSYNLATPDSDGRPVFAPLMLDEAFSKSDEVFSSQALAAFDEFGFQLLIAAPIRLAGIVEPFIGQVVLVEKKVTDDGAHSNLATATFTDLR